MATNRVTQCDKILRELQQANGGWVPLYRMVALASQYNARIKSLRDRGFKIENRLKHNPDGTVFSWFKLVKSPAATD
jgi:hypothetical protein